jgi:predicted DNA binding CopG/RHH family protein
MAKLDREETEILTAFESGNTQRAKNADQLLARHKEYAAATFRKDARINIRLSTRDLRGLQKRALAEGIPYQTLIASILHKYVEGRLNESTKS